MKDSLYLAWKYLSFHKAKTVLLVFSIILIIYLPSGLNVLVNESAENLRLRARQTPLVFGARGSGLELVLNSLYFQSKMPPEMKMAEVKRVQETGFAQAIPIYTRFQARGKPIVGTTLDYFEFRRLKMVKGRQITQMGQCVLGSEVAKEFQLSPGDTVMSSPENAFDLAGVYPLKMKISGILSPSGGPDDEVIFVDLKTSWIIAGLGHGHTDLNRPEASSLLLEKKGDHITANASVVQYNEITEDNAHSFHFHGSRDEFPLTAIIAIPNDEKSRTLLLGRYLSSEDKTQVAIPSEVMDQLLATILKIRSFMIAGAMLIGIATILMAILVFLLSIRLRHREISTMQKLGASFFKIRSILVCEILFVLSVSFLIAGTLTYLTSQFGNAFIHWFII